VCAYSSYEVFPSASLPTRLRRLRRYPGSGGRLRQHLQHPTLKNSPAPANLYQAAIVSTTVAPEAPASIAFVQSVGNNAGYGPASKTLSLTFPTNNTSGNLIVLSVNWGNTAIQVASVTDTRGNV
jgi:hypothetical protein